MTHQHRPAVTLRFAPFDPYEPATLPATPPPRRAVRPHLPSTRLRWVPWVAVG